MASPKRLYTSTGPISCAKKLHQVNLAPATGEAIALGGYQVANRSNASIDVGLFAKQTNAMWAAGSITANANGVPQYTDQSANAKSTTANAFGNLFTTTNNDGFLIQSVKKFSAFSLSIDVAGNGSPTYLYKYYDGTNMSNVPATLSTPDFQNTGATQLVFLPPADWAKGSTNAVGTSNSNTYCIEVVASVAPGKAVKGSDIRVYEQLDYFDNVSDGNQLIDDLGDIELQLPVGYSVAAFFDSANANNFVSLSYRAMSRQV